MDSSTPPIYDHPDVRDSIVPLLATQFPHCVSLLRRIQHNLTYPSRTANVLATFPARSDGVRVRVPDSPWLVAFVDLFRGRETQVFVYSSLQRGGDSSESNTSGGGGGGGETDGVSTLSAATPQTLGLVRAQFLSLLAYIKTNLLPAYLRLNNSRGDDAAAAAAAAEENHDDHRIPPPPPQAFLIGALHTGLFTLLSSSGQYADANPWPGVKIHRYDNPPYVKYTFAPELLDSTCPLPAGYRFEDKQSRRGVQPYQFGLVQSRTHIPRSESSLALMPGLAVYHDSNPVDGDGKEWPVAWAFVGFDGALATLHVEPEHRGRGLAGYLSLEAMKSGLSVDGPFHVPGIKGQDEGWGHVEVATENTASRRVMEKAGGKTGWTVSWTVVELVD